MDLSTGRTLSFYEILEPLGAGGMGEVYRARDTKLDREVAIKLLPEELAGDVERLQRFEREAKTLASLSHTNFAHVYGVDQVGDHCFIAMELVHGEELAERIERGKLPVRDALVVARQLAEALEVAHEAGVVHRDLKPGNVRITPEGVVKVLDFGLAKPMVPGGEGSGAGSAQSDSFLATRDGVVLGTPIYMSPEQARGKPVDRRADIWAFGCVLYECLTGVRAFGRDSMTDVLAAIVGEEPDWSRLPRLPARVEELLRRCLVKDPRGRLRDIGEARVLLQPERLLELERERREEAGGGARWPLALGALALGLVGGAFGVSRVLGDAAPGAGGPTLADAPVVRFAVSPRIDGDGDVIPWGDPRLSPDGRAVLSPGREELVIRALGSLDVTTIPIEAGARHAAWSPDGRAIVYTNPVGLFRVPSEGGRPLRLVSYESGGSAAGNPPAWLDDGRIAFAYTDEGGASLRAVPSAGGDPVRLVSFEGKGIGRDHFHDVAPFPGGRVLAVLHGGLSDDYDIVVVDGSEVTVVLDLAEGELRTPSWVPAGYLTFGRGSVSDGELWAVPFSLERLEATGEPFQLESGVDSPSVSPDGSLVYVEHLDERSSRLAWWSPGEEREAFGRAHEGTLSQPTLASDGKSIAYVVDQDGSFEVWHHDLDRGVSLRLHSSEQRILATRPLPDGTVMYGQLPEDRANWGELTTHRVAVSGLEEPAAWLRGLVLDVAPDGRTAMVIELDEDEQPQTFAVDLDAPDKRRPVDLGAGENGLAISPDARWMLFAGGAGTDRQVYLRGFPEGDEVWRVSVDGAESAMFSEDGDEIVYVKEGALFRVSLETEPEVRLGSPEELGELGGEGLPGFLGGWRDGRMLVADTTGAYGGDLVVVLGWQAELEELVDR
jgi:Tol biopolymer transport system component